MQIVSLVALTLSGPTGAAIGIWQHRKPKRRTLAELHRRARFELERNPTITVYTMVDGREVRRPTEPWRKFRQQMRELGQAFVRVKVSVEPFRESLQRALDAMPDPRVWPPGWGTPVTRPQGFSVAHSLSEPPPARHPDLDVFDAAVAEFESRMDCPHDSSSGGYGPERTWRCDECGEITGREPKR